MRVAGAAALLLVGGVLFTGVFLSGMLIGGMIVYDLETHDRSSRSYTGPRPIYSVCECSCKEAETGCDIPGGEEE